MSGLTVTSRFQLYILLGREVWTWGILQQEVEHAKYEHFFLALDRTNQCADCRHIVTAFIKVTKGKTDVKQEHNENWEVI